MNTVILSLAIIITGICSQTSPYSCNCQACCHFPGYNNAESIPSSIASTAFIASTASTASIKSAAIRDSTLKMSSLFFLLGTLSDYMGRFTYVDKEYEIDRYYYYEKPLVRYLDSIIKSDLKYDITENFINLKYETFSKELSEKLNSFYENGLLIDSLIINPDDVCSFLTGKYYRYGNQMNDSIYRIRLHNTPDHDILDILLKRTGCTRIHLEYLKNIPAEYIYYFIPPERLKAFFLDISGKKNDLDKAYKTAATDLLGPDNELEMLMKSKNAKDLHRIIGIFR